MKPLPLHAPSTPPAAAPHPPQAEIPAPPPALQVADVAKVLACQREEEAKAAHARELEHIQAAEVGANRAKLSAPGVGCMHGEAHVRAVKYLSMKYNTSWIRAVHIHEV